eukprot:scaffold7112_cov219-Pinguiococcus_pyrenoidosus.AAC.3
MASVRRSFCSSWRSRSTAYVDAATERCACSRESLTRWSRAHRQSLLAPKGRRGSRGPGESILLCPCLQPGLRRGGDGGPLRGDGLPAHRKRAVLLDPDSQAVVSFVCASIIQIDTLRLLVLDPLSEHAMRLVPRFLKACLGRLRAGATGQIGRVDGGAQAPKEALPIAVDARSIALLLHANLHGPLAP